MAGRMKWVAGAALGSVLSSCVFAAGETTLNSADRAVIVQTLAKEMNANYIEPALADRVGKAIAKKAAGGGYASAGSPQAFSDALAKDLRAFSGDLHFGARLDAPRRGPDGAADLPGRADAVRLRYGIEKIDHLPGNIGYIDLRSFDGGAAVGAAYSAALAMLGETDALILDLRRNGGGSPDSVAYLMSHFFPPGDRRHLIDIYNRSANTTRQIWTVPAVPQRYAKPVYVLISPRTFSGGEDCAYDFQVQKRGTLVGETTGGGANPVGWFGVGHGIVVAIPTGRATNFVTKTNWEHVGVKPDIAVPAAQALQAAHAALLRKLASATTSDRERANLQRLLAMVEKGDADKPVYTLRGER